MFLKDNQNIGSVVENSSSSINAIAEGSVIKGDITTEGDLRIDGTLDLKLNLENKLAFYTYTYNISGLSISINSARFFN